MLVGVLALQGDFAKHITVLQKLQTNVCEVRTAQDLAHCDALIIPGGESTAILRLIDRLKMREALKAFAMRRPVFGTCAGLILLAKRVVDFPLEPLGLLDIEVERNAFGRQTDSFKTEVACHLPEETKIPAFFIRAPRIRGVAKEVSVLATLHETDEPILVQSGLLLGATFHPELTDSAAVHAYFLKIVAEK